MKLAHADSEIIKHLSEVVTEAQLIDEAFITVECEICTVSKVKQIISHHSAICEMKSYEQIC